MSETNNGGRPLGARYGSGERPRFAVPGRGRWIVVGAVVSASTFLLLTLGGILGGFVARRAAPIWLGAGAGALLGIWGGSWLALGLIDVARSRPHMFRCAAGALGALMVGLLPVIFGKSGGTLWPLIAIVSPGAGAAIATASMKTVSARSGRRRLG